MRWKAPAESGVLITACSGRNLCERWNFNSPCSGGMVTERPQSNNNQRVTQRIDSNIDLRNQRRIYHIEFIFTHINSNTTEWELRAQYEAMRNAGTAFPHLKKYGNCIPNRSATKRSAVCLKKQLLLFY